LALLARTLVTQLHEIQVKIKGVFLMSQIPVKAVTSSNEALDQLTQFRKAIHDEVCEKAFRVFEQKGRQPSNELEDWVEAEHEVVCCPPSELAETKDEIRIRAAVPSFSSRTMQVYVLPNSITIEGQMETTTHPNDEKIHFSELTEKKLLRQFDLPVPIDPERVKATLEDGVLRISAKKAAVAVSPIVVELKTEASAAA
jgi:HSP20 family protein